jgi:hypothetical protein
MSDKYTCALCCKTFEKGWSDEDAKAELEMTFPDTSIDDCDLVCDDCYTLMGFKPDGWFLWEHWQGDILKEAYQNGQASIVEYNEDVTVGYDEIVIEYRGIIYRLVG